MGTKPSWKLPIFFASVVKEGDTIARIGGDEFVILMSDGSPDRLKQEIDRIHKLTSLHRKDRDHPYDLTFSIGSSTYTNEYSEMDGEDFLNKLDALMYIDKAHSKQQTSHR